MLVDLLRADLGVAMKARDQVSVTALRTALAAIANAEAPPLPDHGPSSSLPPVVSRLVEHERLVLTDADLRRILRHHIADRLDTVDRFTAGGRAAEADALRAETAVLERYLD